MVELAETLDRDQETMNKTVISLTFPTSFLPLYVKKLKRPNKEFQAQTQDLKRKNASSVASTFQETSTRVIE